MKFKRAKVFAHRGGRKWAPENTMAAFAKSMQAGVDGIELDIQRCASGELVVIHDCDISRTTDGVGLVKDISYPELKRVGAGAWFDPQFSAEYIPLLQEVLDLVDGKLILNIEIKNSPVDYPDIEDDLIDLLEQYRHQDTVIVSSFDHQVLRRLHAKAPNIPLGILGNSLLVDLGTYLEKIGAKFWHPDFFTLRSDAVCQAQESGIVVNSWTINSSRDWSAALQMGLDGIITDDPAGLIDFLDKVEKLQCQPG